MTLASGSFYLDLQQKISKILKEVVLNSIGSLKAKGFSMIRRDGFILLDRLQSTLFRFIQETSIGCGQSM